MNRFRRLAAASVAASGLLVGWGGLVRATGSGDGCPDWPRCFGRWIPPLEEHALIEYVHRLLATLVVPLIALVAVAAWRRYREVPRVRWPAAAALGLVLLQAALGGVVVLTGLNPGWVTAHFAAAMAVLALQVDVLTASLMLEAPGGPQPEGGRAGTLDPGFARLTAGTAAVAFVLLLVGTYVRAENAGLVFLDWPLMDGRLVPTLGGVATLMFAHRLLAAILVLLVLWTAVRARALEPRSRPAVVLSTTALVLVAAQVMVGAANVWARLAPAAVAGHVALSALLWGVLVALAVASRFLAGPREAARDASPGARPPLRERLTAYARLTKPRIVGLLLLTTVPAMVLAAGGPPPAALVAATLAGGALAAGGANAINGFLDRDIDRVMRRTRRRPLPAGQVRPESALRFGFVLACAAFLFLATTVNVLAAALALSALAFYVFVYTLWLKRTTDQNIVIGGAAGAVPALVGWAAVTGTVGVPALVLFAIVFVWTPPHFWALAMRYAGDYAAAGVPMLPVVRGERAAREQILLYSLLLLAVSLALVPVAGMGPVYLATALVLGGAFVAQALRLWRTPSPGLAWSLFKFSSVYLAVLFAAVAADRLLPLAA